MGISGYLMRQADRKLLACTSSMLSHGFVAVPGSGPVSGQAPPWACEVELPSVSGQGADPRGPGPGPGPIIPGGDSWLTAGYTAAAGAVLVLASSDRPASRHAE